MAHDCDAHPVSYLSRMKIDMNYANALDSHSLTLTLTLI